MFILRRITGEGNQVNLCLGDHYNLVEEHQTEIFKNTLEIFGSGNDDGIIYAFLVYNMGGDVHPLYRPSTYYIMTESGKTFANLTFR